MEVSQIIELMKAVADNGLTDFVYEENGVNLKICKHPEKKIIQPQTIVSGVQPQGMPVGTVAAAPAATSAVTAEETVTADTVDGQVVKSPLVGTFYAASSPDAAPFVQVGDVVKKGQVLGIVEAMKLMNEIESDYEGTVKEILVKNGDVIEFEQPLFVIG